MSEGKRDELAPTEVPGRALSASTVAADPRAREPIASGDPSPFDPARDRFESRGELGRGGMGRVEDAFDRTLGRAVAIKHMLRGSQTDLARFEREARITARLEHPGIVPVHDAGRDADGTPYYVMRRIDGRPLDELVSDASLAERLALIPNVLAACDAVAFAHARRIVHRDIKPTNILVGPFGETLVIDWGLAREIDPAAGASGTAMPVSDDALTAAGAIAGTPGFMAPEQARGETVDARTDVFALGATLFYVLAAKAPYPSTSATELLGLASRGAPPEWSALPARVPADLRAIVGKALAPDPDERYVDATELAADLRRFVTGNLVGAHQYGAWSRLVRFVRRHRAAVAIGLASAIVVAVVAVLSVRRIVAERDDADAARALAEDTADRMLVENARQLASTDPTGAVILLRQLPARSPRWREAWLAAAAAATRGIAIGFRGEPGTWWLDFAADGRRIVTSNQSTARVVIYDLVARTARDVIKLAKLDLCRWLDADHVLCSNWDHGLAIVDVDHATVRRVDLDSRAFVTDKRSRAIVETRDRRIVELRADGTSRELAHDAELAGHSADLARLVLRRGRALELWTEARVLPIGSFATRRGSPIQIRGDAMLGIVDTEIVRWRIADERVDEVARWPSTIDSDALFESDAAFAIGAGQLYLLGDDGARFPDATVKPSAAFATDRGFIAATLDGSLVVYEGDRVLRLGPFPMQANRIDESPDGRFLTALTDRGEVLAWDLAALARHDLPLGNMEQVIELRESHAWTVDPTRGLARRELGGGDAKLAIHADLVSDSFEPYSLSYYIPDDERWVALASKKQHAVWTYDATSTPPTTRWGNVAAWHSSARGVVFANLQGRITRWTPGASELVELMRLPAAPASVYDDGDLLVVKIGDKTFARFDLSTGRREDAAVPDAVGSHMTLGRRTWIATVAGELWRWDPGAAPVRVEIKEHVEDVRRVGEHVVADTARSLVVVDVDPPRAVAIDARAIAWMREDYVAALSARGVVSVIDLQTGGSFELPIRADSKTLAAHGDTLLFDVAAAPVHKSTLVELGVPHAPAALRRWLAEITNARTPESGRGAAWP